MAGRFEVRRAGLSDAATVAILNRHVHDLHVEAEPEQFHSTNLSEVEHFFQSLLPLADHLVFVAEGQEALGYIWAQDIVRPRTPFTSEARVVYIHHLSVAPTARRIGVASALCRAVEDEARSRGIDGVGLDYWSFNSDAAAFFARAGFVEFNTRVHKRLD